MLEGVKTHGNRCGHDPRNPNLRAAKPIRKGKGGLPRILSLAAERVKTWYAHPKKCPPLLQNKGGRKTRSERREALQIVLETILQHLDLASLCLGVDTQSGIWSAKSILLELKETTAILATIWPDSLGAQKLSPSLPSRLRCRYGFASVDDPEML